MKQCGECTLCCKSLAVVELKKPQNRWCTHCSIGAGCTIYETRPPTCRVFECAWKQVDGMPDDLRPDRVHSVVSFNEDHQPLVHIDPATPDQYRRGRLHWFIELCRQQGLDVVIVAGDRRKLLTNYKGESAILKRPAVQEILNRG